MSASVHAGIHTSLRADTPSGADPPEQTPLGADTPPGADPLEQTPQEPDPPEQTSPGTKYTPQD